MIGTTARRNLARGAVAAVAAAALAVGGCASNEPELVTIQPAPPGGVPEEVTLSRANVAALAIAANDATMRRAQVARTEAADPQVRAFATRVLTHSQMARQLMQQELNRLDLVPEPEATSHQVELNATRTIALMREADGLQVDRIYLESQIDNDRWLIQTLDSILSVTPEAKAQDVMVDIRSRIKDRLQRAEQLQASVKSQLGQY